MKPAKPTEGRFPSLTYTYDEDAGTHNITCDCKAATTTTDEGTARYFAAGHVAKHARGRIVTPPEPDPE